MDVVSEIKEAFVENKRIFLIVIALFILGFIIGWIFADDIAPYFLPILQEALGKDNTSLEALNILSHNLTSAFTTYLLSIFFGIYAFLTPFTNGFAVGFIGGYSVKTPTNLILFLVLILPHGIIEIPAIWCESVSGALLFLFLIKTIKDILERVSLKKAYEYNKKNLKHSLVLLLISIVLFIIAAFIEGFITPFLGNLISIWLTGVPLFN